MKSNLSAAIAAILGGVSAASSLAAAAESGTEALEEITVTAQRREQSIQDVPISMQALTGQTLQQLNISTFDDYIKFLPNVTSANNGPGQSEVFMRGLSAGSQASQGSSSTGLYPNVAIYLDNQSGQLPNRNLDIYAADLNRIEVLEGPQGTLFGAGAEAGVIRYITNQPKIDVTEASVKAGYGTTAHGDNNADLTAVLNLPLMPEHLAARVVIYDDRRGGYIDNVPATFARKDTDIGIHYAGYPAVNGACPDGQPNNGYCVPPGSSTVSNASIVGRAINPVTYQGVRAQLLFKINDDWDALLAQTYQEMHSQGVFYQQPNASDGAPMAPLEVTLFNPAYNNDGFEMTSLTIDGKLGPLKAVYTGGYLVRHVEQSGDYTNYSRGVYADYYQCYGLFDLSPTCFSPNAYWHTEEQNKHMQHEVRVSTPDDWRVRAIAGAFYEDNQLFDHTAWSYKGVPECTATRTTGCFTDLGTFPGSTVDPAGIRPASESFYQDNTRETKQTAFFASVDVDLIPKALTLTAGTRHFLFENSYKGSVMSSFGCYEAGTPPGGCTSSSSYNLDAQHLQGSESGFKNRANLNWHVTPDVMLYYTWSQGFRPGGFDENGGTPHIYGTDGKYQYLLPRSWDSDKLTNNELGWKTEFFDHRFQWNGAVYRENWDNVQISFFDPGLVGNLFFNANGQNFLVKGVETSMVARVFGGLSLQGAASWNQTRQTNSPALMDNNPASANYGHPITQACDSSGGSCTAITNPFGPVGSPTANAPPMQFSARARYEWSFRDHDFFAQFGATHTGHSFTQAGSNPTFAGAGNISTSRLRFENGAYSTVSASIGVAKDAWNVMLFGENLANSNASTFTSTDNFIVEQTPLRPRVLGVSFGYKTQ
ncbi:MAG TPA: TonB-dependent receptor [Steroidobacteraceae bacterium]|jgi:outer membrane receptor protein involved in Fe transport|nr:TonB-dependent receptor [Steroidobacteraceae bacterium]